MASIRREQDAQGRSSHSLSLKTILSRRGYRWQLFLVLMIFLESEFCGVNAIGMYTNKIFTKAGIPDEYVTYASLVVYFVQFLVSLAGVSFLHRGSLLQAVNVHEILKCGVALFDRLLLGAGLILDTTKNTHYRGDSCTFSIAAP